MYDQANIGGGGGAIVPPAHMVPTPMCMNFHTAGFPSGPCTSMMLCILAMG